MSGELELEQRLADLAEQTQAATLELGQRLAEAVELLADRGGEDRLEKLLSMVQDSLGAALSQDSATKIAEAIISGIKGIRIQTEVKVEPPVINLNPIIKVPEQVPPQVTVHVDVPPQPTPDVNVHFEAAKEWRLSGVKYDQSGRIVDASIKRVS